MIVSEAIQFVGETYGSLVVAAAGNDSTPWGKIDIDTSLRYPASYTTEYLLVIAATEKSGRIASYSNVGKKNVDLAAPGSDIYSTLPNNDYGSLSGTSMATPTTVGVAAQILSFYPNLNPIALKKVLMNTVTKVTPFEKWMVSGGRVDLFESFVLLQNNPNQ
jgi:thermitase